MGNSLVEPVKMLEPDASPLNVRTLGRWFVAGVIVLAVAKLWMVHTEEIVATRSYTLDDWWYLNSASHWYWGTKYAVNAFVRQPGYPLWIALVKATGIPLRVATEVFQLVAAVVLVLALLRARLPRALCLMVFAAIVFHPASFQVNSQALPDGFYAALLWSMLAGMILQLCTPKSRYAVLTGISAAVSLHTREESVLIISCLAFFWLLVLGRARRQGLNWTSAVLQSGRTVLIPAVIVLVSCVVVNTANLFAFGVFARSDMVAPAYEAANRALLRIRPPQSSDRFVPVSRAARELAYSASPAFRDLQQELDGETGSGSKWKARSHRQLGVADDIAGGWFRWALREAAARRGHHGTARAARAFYRKVATEINTACDDGRLPSRFVFSSFLDPDFKKYAPFLPASFLRVTKQFVRPDWPLAVRGLGADAQSRDFFDRMTNRRSALIHGYETAYLSGWACCVIDPVQAIAIRRSDGTVLASVHQFSARPDVASQFRGESVRPEMGFVLDVPLKKREGFDGDLVFQTKSGREFAVPANQIQAGPSQVLSNDSSPATVTYRIENCMFDPPFSPRAERVRTLIARSYGRMVGYLTYASVVAIGILVVCRRFAKPTARAHAVVGLLLVVIACRVAVFTPLDATSLALSSSRYMFPTLPLYTGALLIVIYLAIRAATAWGNARLRKSSEPGHAAIGVTER